MKLKKNKNKRKIKKFDPQHHQRLKIAMIKFLETHQCSEVSMIAWWKMKTKEVISKWKPLKVISLEECEKDL